MPIASVVEQIAGLSRMAGYHIVRPSLATTVPEVRQWLPDLGDGGWQQGDDDARIKAAARLLFAVWLIRQGRLNGATDDA